MLRATLSVVPSTDEMAAPVVLSFPSTTPPGLQSAEGSSRLRLELRRNPSDRKKHQCEAVLQNDTIKYTGVNYGRDGTAAKSAGAFLIGVHHKGSGTVKLAAAQLYVMKPAVKAPKVSLEPPEEFSVTISSGAEYNDRKRQLVSQLGAAKARKRQRVADTGAVSSNAVLDALALNADISGAAREAADKPVVELSEIKRHPLHPPFDLAATSAAHAYPRSSFAPDRVWDSLDYKPLRAASKSAEELEKLAAEPTLFPPYVLGLLAGKLPGDKLARTHLLRATLYLTHMLRFSSLHAPIAPIREGSEGHPDAQRLRVPPDSWAQLLEDFTEPLSAREGEPLREGFPTKRRVTPPLREKLAMHCLALALVHVGGGRLRCDALAATLGLTEQKVGFYLKQLGCLVEKAGGGKVGVLRLPLQFPKASRGGPPKR